MPTPFTPPAHADTDLSDAPISELENLIKQSRATVTQAVSHCAEMEVEVKRTRDSHEDAKQSVANLTLTATAYDDFAARVEGVLEKKREEVKRLEEEAKAAAAEASAKAAGEVK